MDIPEPTMPAQREMDRGSRKSIAARMLVVAVAIASCGGPPVRPAPFRVRPDAAEAGSLRGPFNGRVVDATTHAPIAGALIYAAWTYERGTGFLQPAGAHEYVGSTDAGGNYQVPRLPDRSPSAARVTNFSLLVYKRGYIAYRSERRFSDLGLRLDFAQRDNQVLLERWRNELSHVRHLRFVGGGATVAALTQWELADATTELAGIGDSDHMPGGGSRGAFVVAAQLLTGDDIKARTKYDGDFETGPLSDEPDTSTYSSQHFKAKNHAESWDVAIRMWYVDPAKAQERYQELSSQLPGVEEKDEVASRSFRAEEDEIRGVGFLDAPRGAVVLLTCGSRQCASVDDAVALAQIAYERLKQLAPQRPLPAPSPTTNPVKP